MLQDSREIDKSTALKIHLLVKKIENKFADQTIEIETAYQELYLDDALSNKRGFQSRVPSTVFHFNGRSLTTRFQ